MKAYRSTVTDMWDAYLSSIKGEDKPKPKHYTVFHFCNNKNDADMLAGLVKTGRKRATASSLIALQDENEPLPEKGDYSIIIDWNGIAQCVIRTIHVVICPFNQVSDEFAAKEGEGDGSLEYWQYVHKRVFYEELSELGEAFSEVTPVVCEEFEVVYQ